MITVTHLPGNEISQLTTLAGEPPPGGGRAGGGGTTKKPKKAATKAKPKK